VTFPLTVPVEVHEYSAGSSDGYGGTTDTYTPPLTEVGDQVLVFAIYTGTTAEPKVVGHDRVTVDGEMLGPPGLVSAHGVIDHETLGRFEVIGEAEDYNHNPWFQPGLVVYNLRRVEG
jgi:hypothetical protein